MNVSSKHQKHATIDSRYIPVQVCKGGCGFTAFASRRYKTTTEWWGRVTVSTFFDFEFKFCPVCGWEMASECPSKKCNNNLILNATHTHCPSCGVLYPWTSARSRDRVRALGRNWHKAASSVWHNDVHTIWMLEADITTLAVDAVVSDDDINGQMRNGAAVAIKRACGEMVEHLSIQQGPHSIGSAWITEAGQLGVKHVIHVAVVDNVGATSLSILENATRAAIILAESYRVSSIAFPIMGSGTAQLQYDDCVKTLARACHEQLKLSAASLPRDIVLVLFSPASFANSFTIASRAILDQAKASADPSNLKPTDK